MAIYIPRLDGRWTSSKNYRDEPKVIYDADAGAWFFNGDYAGCDNCGADLYFPADGEVPAIASDSLRLFVTFPFSSGMWGWDGSGWDGYVSYLFEFTIQAECIDDPVGDIQSWVLEAYTASIPIAERARHSTVDPGTYEVIIPLVNGGTCDLCPQSAVVANFPERAGRDCVVRSITFRAGWAKEDEAPAESPCYGQNDRCWYLFPAPEETPAIVCRWTNFVRSIAPECVVEEPGVLEDIYQVVGVQWNKTGSGYDETGLPTIKMNEDGTPEIQLGPTQYAAEEAICETPNWNPTSYVACSILNKDTGMLVPASQIEIDWTIEPADNHPDGPYDPNPTDWDPPILADVSEDNTPYPVFQVFCGYAPSDVRSYHYYFLVRATIDGVLLPVEDCLWIEQYPALD